MNSNYLYEYANYLERVLSYGYKNNYSNSSIEREISYNHFFQLIENDHYHLPPITTDTKLIKELYKVDNVDLESLPTYNQCLWAAESYIRIQHETSLTFECIFLYIPIAKMYEYYPLYHEMDFSQIINEFLRQYKKESVLSILLNKYDYSLKDISNMISVPYDTLYSLKQRRREMTKVSFTIVNKLARVFNVRLETISETVLK